MTDLNLRTGKGWLMSKKHGTRSGVDRRKFIKGSAGMAAGLSVGLSALDAAAQREGRGRRRNRSEGTANREATVTTPPSETVLVGLIGCGGRGFSVLEDFMRQKDVKVIAMCDVDSNRLNESAAKVEKKYEKAPEKFGDYRALLEVKDLDAVLVATPDHWHCLPVVQACERGLDVYVEKPLAHSIVEGRAMVNAAREHNRIVQIGTQQRSAKHFQQAVEYVKSGQLGQITYCRTWNYENNFPSEIGYGSNELPDGVDYDLWLGPAPEVPFNSNRFHYQWRWFFDYAGGQLADWGVHLIDIMQWAMDAPAPEWISAAGHKYAIQDNRDTPDTITVTYEYPANGDRPPFLMTYENQKCAAMGSRRHGYGIEFHGTQGSLFVDRGGFEVIPQTRGEGENRKPLIEARKVEGGTPTFTHVRNFLDCMKSRELPISDVEIGHRSTSTPHLGNIALRTGRRLHWDAEKEEFTNYGKANDLLGREYRKPWDKEARHLPLPRSKRKLLTGGWI